MYTAINWAMDLGFYAGFSALTCTLWWILGRRADRKWLQARTHVYACRLRTRHPDDLARTTSHLELCPVKTLRPPHRTTLTGHRCAPRA